MDRLTTRRASPCASRHHRGPAVLPDVLADVHPDVYATDIQNADAVAGREVALLVEDRVVGQADLAVRARPSLPPARTAAAL